ncbi:hypothetical protein ACFLQK_02330, partial [bacterium]
CDTFCAETYESQEEVDACMNGCLWAVLSLADEMMGEGLGGETSFVTASEDGLCTYRTEEIAFSFKCPPNTEMQEDPMSGSVAFLSPLLYDFGDMFAENVNIIVDDLAKYDDITLEKFIAMTRLSIETFLTDPEYVDDSSYEMGGVPAHKLIYTGKMDMSGIKYELKWEQVTVLHNNKGIIITYTCEPEKHEEYRNLLLSIIETFEFL